MTRRAALGPVLLALWCAHAAAGGEKVGPNTSLYEQFRSPPKQFGLMPYWFWNGTVTAEETRRQMRSMIEQGVHSAIIFPWDGMQPGFLSEAWWQALGDALDAAAELGFTLNLNDDFTWPSGHGWDHYQQGAELSRVLAGSPEYRMKQLVAEEIVLDGPAQWDRAFESRPEVIVVGRVEFGTGLVPDTLQVIESQGQAVSWRVPAGKWKAFVYTPREVTGAHNTRVDLLNEAAVRKYIDLFYEELARRCSQHLGTTLRLTTADHEGTCGLHPIWTPGLWEAFQARHGYDLRPLLPLLRYEGGGRSRKLRCDYFDLIGALYRKSFVEQVTRWCEAHGFGHTASFYEEQLAFQVDRAGDMPAIWRTTSAVEIDALLERARMPIDFKEAVSVAHFENKKLLVENQGLQGHDSFISPEKMRLGSNMALLWGADALIPYFDYDPNKVQWPPQWFEGQPYWRYFHHYADYVRRVSFMNSRGRHVAPVALFYPLRSAWADAAQLFDPTCRNKLNWNNAMDDVQAYYGALELQLSRNGWDYHILDDHYLKKAVVDGAALHLADEVFRVVILPPLTTIERAAMSKLGEFFDSGGKILAAQRLPLSSPDADGDDPEIVEAVVHVFGEAATRGEKVVNRSARGGAAHFFPCGQYAKFMNVLDYTKQVEVPPEYQRDLAPALETLAQYVRREAKVIRGRAAGIYVSHRHEDKTHWYWVVNDSDQSTQVTLSLAESGVAQRWDPLTGDRWLLPYRASERGCEVDLQLDPWGGSYVVLTRSGAGLSARSRTETVATLDLSANRWRFTPQASEVLVPYARVRVGKAGEGEKRGWHQPSADTASWDDEWLSVERLANRSWWMIGPFPYGDHQGYNTVFPPEQEIRLDRRYTGQGDKPVGWVYRTSPSYWVNVRELLEIPSPANSVAYALSYVYSPSERQGHIRVAFADSIKLWWNGREKLAVHRHPKWMLLRDPWSESAPVTIKQGWNRVLLKICRSENRPISFLFRIADARGNTLKDLVYGRMADGVPSHRPSQGEKWYRVNAPPGTRAAMVPLFQDLQQVYVNGKKVDGQPGQRIDLPAGAPVPVVFRCGPHERLEHPVRFVTGTTDLALGPWTQTGLAHYSGIASYESEFQLDRVAPGAIVELDCGTVGLTAEVWVNGAKAGERVWRPYTFDITPHVRAGANALKIIVANSAANWQCQGDPIYPAGSWGTRITSERQRLRSIQRNGLIGPVTIRISSATAR